MRYFFFFLECIFFVRFSLWMWLYSFPYEFVWNVSLIDRCCVLPSILRILSTMVNVFSICEHTEKNIISPRFKGVIYTLCRGSEMKHGQHVSIFKRKPKQYYIYREKIVWLKMSSLLSFAFLLLYFICFYGNVWRVKQNSCTHSYFMTKIEIWKPKTRPF